VNEEQQFAHVYPFLSVIISLRHHWWGSDVAGCDRVAAMEAEHTAATGSGSGRRQSVIECVGQFINNGVGIAAQQVSTRRPRRWRS